MTGERVYPADRPLLWRGGVLVVGGGSAGAAAAVAAARLGQSVLLVEADGFLGGTGARVLDSFYGFYAPGADQRRRVVGGVGWEIVERLTAMGQAFERPSSYGAGTAVTYEPEALKVVWDRMVLDSSARVLLNTRVSGVVMDGDRVTGVNVETVAGPGRLRADAIIDASGDAAVAHWAGATLARPGPKRRTQPMTMTFRVGGVPDPALTAVLHERLAATIGDDAFDLPRLEGSTHRTVLPGVQHTNLTRVAGLDPTDPWQLSAAEIEGRRQVWEYTRFLRERVPGYEDSYLLQTPSRIGVRESRRLVGEYVLTREDVLTAADFPDAIARCGAPIEDHDAADGTRWEYVGGERTGRTYGIPYRCLIPSEVDGLLVAGRCLSATHDAHASVRSMGQCMAMGHAAGVAAALATARGQQPRALDVTLLREQLTTDGALL